jgi:hypothetical protein
MSNLELWKLKTGKSLPKDLSGNEAVQAGIKMEPIIRAMYKADRPEMDVTYHPYDVLYQEEMPYLRATLDGELFEKATKRYGVLEIKNVNVSSGAVYAKWRNGVPSYYLAQCFGQLICTGFDFVDLVARMKMRDGDCSIRTYRLEKDEEQMEIVREGVRKQWRYIQERKEPPMMLPPL